MTTQKIKKVRAWVVHQGIGIAEEFGRFTDIRGFAIFSSKKKADLWRRHWKNRDTMFITPCTITYSLPITKSKK